MTDFLHPAHRANTSANASLFADVAHEPSAANPKREQILQGATQVFLEHGYAGTSMDRVAAQAGVSKQTIYSHFQDKNGLFSALFERITIQRLRADLHAVPLKGEPRQALRRLAEAFLKKMDDPEYLALIRLVIGESGRFPELAQLFTQTVIQFGFRAISSYLTTHPELNIRDPEATTRIFFGSLVAFILSQELLLGKLTMPMERSRLIDSLMICILGDE
jgi:AcrR family transcriptional regulator